MNHSFCHLIFTCLKIIDQPIPFHWTMIVRTPIHSCERLSTARSLVVLMSHWSALGNGLRRKKWIQSSKREGLGDSVVYNDFVQESSIQNLKIDSWSWKAESFTFMKYSLKSPHLHFWNPEDCRTDWIRWHKFASEVTWTGVFWFESEGIEGHTLCTKMPRLQPQNKFAALGGNVEITWSLLPTTHVNCGGAMGYNVDLAGWGRCVQQAAIYRWLRRSISQWNRSKFLAQCKLEGWTCQMSHLLQPMGKLSKKKSTMQNTDRLACKWSSTKWFSNLEWFIANSPQWVSTTMQQCKPWHEIHLRSQK